MLIIPDSKRSKKKNLKLIIHLKHLDTWTIIIEYNINFLS